MLCLTLSSPSHPNQCHRAPPRSGFTRQSWSPRRPRGPLPPPSPVHAAMAPLASNGRGHYRPPRATDRHASHPPVSFSRLHVDAPTPTLLFPLCPAPLSCLSKAPSAVPLPSFPCPSPEHRHPPCPCCKLTRPVSGTRRRATPPV
jgi:hypothetical protein